MKWIPLLYNFLPFLVHIKVLAWIRTLSDVSHIEKNYNGMRVVSSVPVILSAISYHGMTFVIVLIAFTIVADQISVAFFN